MPTLKKIVKRSQLIETPRSTPRGVFERYGNKKNTVRWLTRLHAAGVALRHFFQLIVILGLTLLSFTPAAFAQGKIDQPVAQPLVTLIALSALALVPILLMMMSSFVKIGVVLALLRTALGTQQIPPNQVITSLAIILTLYVMAPVATQAYKNAESVINQTSTDSMLSQATLGLARDALKKAQEPMRDFLKRNTSGETAQQFLQLARDMRKTEEEKKSISRDDFLVLIPSFVVSELARAFQIGFMIFLPFLVIDMVVANILLSLGMFQLSPITVSLPFKLLLFVMVKGWYLLSHALVSSYAK